MYPNGSVLPHDIYYSPEVETCSRDQLISIQWDKLTTLLQNTWEKSLFYQKKWAKEGLQNIAEIKTREQFYKLPFTNKSELVTDQQVTPPFGTNLTYPFERYVRQHQTSGTTGSPLKWLDTDESWDWWAKCWAFVYKGAGVKPGDKIYFPFSFGPFIGFWAAFEGARKLKILAIPGGGQDSPVRLNSILENNITVIVCTPSYAMRLAEIAEQQGVNIKDSRIRITIHAGEPGACVASTKEKIESMWGANSFDHYGMTEAGAMGFECTAHEGTHLIESEFIFEVINPETLKHVSPGEEGELVVTNLGRLGMPLIRYRTGDRVKLDTTRCSCGRVFARAVGGILGRADDMIIIRGVNVFPGAIENIVHKYQEVKEFLIEVHKVKEMFELKLLLEMDEDIYNQNRSGDIVNFIIDDIRKNLSIRVMAEARPPGSLPRFELKAKRLVKCY